MNVKELIERYNAEQVGSRLIATVDGRKEYIADVGNGGFQLTAVGLKLQHEHEAAKELVEEKAPAPKAKKAKVKSEPDTKPTELETSLDADLSDLDDLLGE